MMRVCVCVRVCVCHSGFSGVNGVSGVRASSTSAASASQRRYQRQRQQRVNGFNAISGVSASISKIWKNWKICTIAKRAKESTKTDQEALKTAKRGLGSPSSVGAVLGIAWISLRDRSRTCDHISEHSLDRLGRPDLGVPCFLFGLGLNVG